MIAVNLNEKTSFALSSRNVLLTLACLVDIPLWPITAQVQWLSTYGVHYILMLSLPLLCNTNPILSYLMALVLFANIHGRAMFQVDDDEAHIETIVGSFAVFTMLHFALCRTLLVGTTSIIEAMDEKEDSFQEFRGLFKTLPDGFMLIKGEGTQ